MDGLHGGTAAACGSTAFWLRAALGNQFFFRHGKEIRDVAGGARGRVAGAPEGEKGAGAAHGAG
ncbi:MAG: hypothetical protein WBG17_09855 [Burkholderiaceae bacterium]